MRPPASSFRCLLCERPAQHWHHLTGRCAPDRPHFDDGLVVPLCRRCHAREQTVLRTLDLEWPRTDDPVIAHRVRRLAVFAGRCGDLARPFTLDPESSLAMGALLVEAACALVRS